MPDLGRVRDLRTHVWSPLLHCSRPEPPRGGTHLAPSSHDTVLRQVEAGCYSGTEFAATHCAAPPRAPGRSARVRHSGRTNHVFHHPFASIRTIGRSECDKHVNPGIPAIPINDPASVLSALKDAASSAITADARSNATADGDFREMESSSHDRRIDTVHRHRNSRIHRSGRG
ncbi:hypothetical protein HMPREF0724_10651 [Prescottella equi ATCC 33707]|uniref:Uncharacterized protein n=1 Tax=Prescottella equi ATCC 33707 TaxID=525370 RepID=E9SX01_RHOHA|nr:hypothetical protein HMPREF0724_10651 [Prescottella equi ATCC 33707]